MPNSFYKDLVSILQQVQERDIEKWDKNPEWDKDPEWEKAVALPVKTHNLSPRDAFVILEVFGVLADRGMNLQFIFKLLFDDFTKNRWAEILLHGTK